MVEIPQNPQKLPDYVRGDVENDFEDLIQVLDRQRRNYELMEGSEDQEDASASDAFEVAAGTKAIIKISPGENEVWLVEQVSVQPFDPVHDYTLSAGEFSTDSNVLPFGVPVNMTGKIKIEVSNNKSNKKTFTYETDARAAPMR